MMVTIAAGLGVRLGARCRTVMNETQDYAISESSTRLYQNEAQLLHSHF